MLRIAFVTLWTIITTIAGLLGAVWYLAPERPVSQTSEHTKSIELKSDYISIAVFSESKVIGYITFRALMTLISKDLEKQALWAIYDHLNRSRSDLAPFSFAEPDESRIAMLTAELLAAIRQRISDAGISDIKLSDFNYVERTQ